MSPFTAKSTIGTPFIELTEVESTNIYAMDMIQANMAAHGTCFFASSQTAGKGQQGKIWVTEPGSNIILSVVLDSSAFSLARLFELSLTVSLACHDFFSAYATGETRIKWPNDIYWRDRKAGGILIENIIRGDKWLWSVVGVGINLNQVLFPDTAKNPVSLRQVTGKEFNTVSMAKDLCVCLENRYQYWLEWGGKQLLKEYNDRLYKKDEWVKLKKDNRVFFCRVKNVSETGELLVEGGVEDRFRFGEVEWVI